MVQYELWLNIMQGTDFEVSVTDTPKMFRLVPFRYTFLFVLDLIGSLRCLPIDMHNNNNTKKKHINSSTIPKAMNTEISVVLMRQANQHKPRNFYYYYYYYYSLHAKGQGRQTFSLLDARFTSKVIYQPTYVCEV
jgi:hypothetical protein